MTGSQIFCILSLTLLLTGLVVLFYVNVQGLKIYHSWRKFAKHNQLSFIRGQSTISSQSYVAGSYKGYQLRLTATPHPLTGLRYTQLTILFEQNSVEVRSRKTIVEVLQAVDFKLKGEFDSQIVGRGSHLFYYQQHGGKDRKNRITGRLRVDYAGP